MLQREMTWPGVAECRVFRWWLTRLRGNEKVGGLAAAASSQDAFRP